MFFLCCKRAVNLRMAYSRFNSPEVPALPSLGYAFHLGTEVSQWRSLFSSSSIKSTIIHVAFQTRTHTPTVLKHNVRLPSSSEVFERCAHLDRHPQFETRFFNHICGTYCPDSPITFSNCNVKIPHGGLNFSFFTS